MHRKIASKREHVEYQLASSCSHHIHFTYVVLLSQIEGWLRFTQAERGSSKRNSFTDVKTSYLVLT
jgi:hypothetical protein